MTIVEDLRQLLVANGIDDTQYTDEELTIFIDTAKTVIGLEYTESIAHEDYVEKIQCRKYMTNYYPIAPDSVCVLVDGEEVTAKKITKEGIIYFYEIIDGEFSCTYLQAIDTDLIDYATRLLSLYTIQEKEGTGAVSSIAEGDISISYDTNSSASNSNRVARIVDSIRSKYKARVRLL